MVLVLVRGRFLSFRLEWFEILIDREVFGELLVVFLRLVIFGVM